MKSHEMKLYGKIYGKGLASHMQGQCTKYYFSCWSAFNVLKGVSLSTRGAVTGLKMNHA